MSAPTAIPGRRVPEDAPPQPKPPTGASAPAPASGDAPGKAKREPRSHAPAAASPLSRKQVAGLCAMARRAFDQHRENGLIDGGDTFDAWRRREAIAACGFQMSAAEQRHYRRLLGWFAHLAGEDGQAFAAFVKTDDKGETEKREQARFKLEEACREGGLDYPSYPEAICRRQFKCPLGQATAEQLWSLFYTCRNRRKN